MTYKLKYKINMHSLHSQVVKSCIFKHFTSKCKAMFTCAFNLTNENKDIYRHALFEYMWSIWTYLTALVECILRHTIVCRVAQEASVRHSVSILTGRNKTWFSHLCSSEISYPNLLQRCPPGRQVYIPNLTQIAPAVFEIQVFKVSFKFLRFFFFLFFVFSHT